MKTCFYLHPTVGIRILPTGEGMNFKVEGKRALVMGGSSGIGMGIAKALRDEGVRVAIVARDVEKLRRAAGEIGAEHFESADLYDPDQARKATLAIQEKLGGIDILVTHNGGPPKGRFQDLSRADWQRGFEGLWLSATESIQALLPAMQRRRWGRVLLVTSIAAREPLPGLPVSSGLRAGLGALAKSLSDEVARDGVTVNAVLPGYTATGEALQVPQLIEKIPARRLATPAEVGALASFLSSEQASYITGQSIACDGGFLRGL